MKAAILVVVLLSVLGSICSGLQLETAIHLSRNQLTAGQSLLVHFAVTNPTQTSVTFLKYNTPFDEAVYDDIFKVVREDDGLSAQYVGMKAKRVSPTTMRQYITLLPGQTLSSSIDITESYRFVDDGRYSVQFVSAPTNVQPHFIQTSQLAGVMATLSSTETVHLSVNATNLQPVQAYRKTYAGQNCNSADDKTVADAIVIAKSEANQALNYLTAQRCDQSYVTWFGAKTSNRYNKITRDYGAIVQRLNAGVNHYCRPAGCGRNVFAYVYPNDPTHTIYLCGAFWAAPNGIHQEDSKPGTLVHESSHFSDVAGTDDIQYGSNGCRQLAQRDPDSAINNADSHEYFVEFNPAC